MTGATTSTCSEAGATEESSMKHMSSLERGETVEFTPLPQAYCWLMGVVVVGTAFSKLTWEGENTPQVRSWYTSPPWERPFSRLVGPVCPWAVGNGADRSQSRQALASLFQLSAATMTP